MTRWITGPHSGEEIMYMTSVGHWSDRYKDVHVTRVEENVLGVFKSVTYRVTERTASGDPYEWLNTQSFDHAIKLAERLVVGKVYIHN